MSEVPTPDARPGRQTVRRHGKRPARDLSAAHGIESRLVTLGVLPSTASAVLAGGAVVSLQAMGPAGFSAGKDVIAGAAAVACVAVTYFAGRKATALARAIRAQATAADQEVQEQISALRSTAASCREALEAMGDRADRGGPLMLPSLDEPYSYRYPRLELLDQELRDLLTVAQQAVDRAASHRQVEVSVNLTRRLQTLIGRAIKELDDLENEVEDPDLLKGLFSVDHLATRVRRQAESLAVLGGAVSRRFSSPVGLNNVLRSAVAEVEQYARVTVIPPIEGTLRGHSVADVIHLIAELVENATIFSPPNTSVSLRAQPIAAGVALEIEDRGLGLEPQNRQRLNGLLTAPERFDMGDLFKDGRIGLYVVATLARRHGIAVELQSNVYRGTSAVVVLPQELLGNPPDVDTPSPVDRQITGPARGALAPTPSATRPGPPPSPQNSSLPGADGGAGPDPVGQGPQPRRAIVMHASVEQPATSLSFDTGTDLPLETSSDLALKVERNGTQGQDAVTNAARPPLPQRSGSYMAPELLNSPDARTQSSPDHTPGLLAAYLSGLSRSVDPEAPQGDNEGA